MKLKIAILLCFGTMLLGSCASDRQKQIAEDQSIETKSSSEAEQSVDIGDFAGTASAESEPTTEQSVERESEQMTESSADYEQPAGTNMESGTEEINDEETTSAESQLDDTAYIGEYLDDVVNQPNLEIAKGDDGKYIVQIGIFRLTLLSDGIGELTADGMKFTATDAAGNPISGVITIDGQTASVTFTDSTWEYLPNGSVYEYTKSSDIPNLEGE